MRGPNERAVWLTQTALKSCSDRKLETGRDTWKKKATDERMRRFQITQSFTDAPLWPHSSGCGSPFSARLSAPGPGGGPRRDQKPSSSSRGPHSTHIHITTHHTGLLLTCLDSCSQCVPKTTRPLKGFMLSICVVAKDMMIGQQSKLPNWFYCKPSFFPTIEVKENFWCLSRSMAAKEWCQ